MLQTIRSKIYFGSGSLILVSNQAIPIGARISYRVTTHKNCASLSLVPSCLKVTAQLSVQSFSVLHSPSADRHQLYKRLSSVARPDDFFQKALPEIQSTHLPADFLLSGYTVPSQEAYVRLGQNSSSTTATPTITSRLHLPSTLEESRLQWNILGCG